MSMLFLEPGHAAVRDTLNKIVAGESDYLAATINELDGTRYSIYVDEETNNLVLGMATILPKKKLIPYNVDDALTSVLGADRVLPGDEYHDVIVKLGTVDPETQELKGLSAKLINSVSSLRTTFMMAPLGAGTALHLSTKKCEIRRFQYRPSEVMYMGSYKDNFCVTITIKTETRDDRLLTRMFLQEFQGAKKHERSIASSVGFSYTTGKIPMEIADAAAGVIKENPEDPNLFFVTFVLGPKHGAAENLATTTQHLINFRSNFFFHLSGMKAYLHNKMRARVTALLKVLARAKTDTTGKSTTMLK
eukprot:PhM_4_TR1865/c0_g1_i1/m.6971/K05758/ARPC2; actin related protein 2/3 complex, subunit 2